MWPWNQTENPDMYTPFEVDDPENAKRRFRRKGIASAVLLVLGATGLAWAMVATRPTPVDPATLCVRDAPPARHVVVLVDRSDAMTDLQKTALLGSLQTHQRSLRVGDRLTLYLLTPNDGIRPVHLLFDRCRPKTRAESDERTESGRHNQALYEAQFQAPFKQALSELEDGEPATTSPLMEAVHEILRGPAVSETAQERVLELWSDLLQNSALVNQFRPGYRIENLEGSEYLRTSALAGVHVVVHQFANKYRSHQTSAHRTFWSAYFKRLGVQENDLEFMQL
jgi:hypothetical protein